MQPSEFPQVDDSPLNLEQDDQIQAGRQTATQDESGEKTNSDFAQRSACSCPESHRELLTQGFETWT